MDFATYRHQLDQVYRKDAASEAAEKVLLHLLGRAGFDHWWASMDSETQSDVRQSLATVLLPYVRT